MWPTPQFPANLVTFTEEILNEKLHSWAVFFVHLWIPVFLLMLSLRTVLPSLESPTFPHRGFWLSLTGEICSLTFVTLVWVILIFFVRSLDLYFLLSSYFFLYLAKNQSKKHENLKKKKTEKINIFVRLNIFFVFLYVSCFVNGWGIFQSQWVWAAVKPLILESCGKTVLLYLLISLQRFEIVVLRSSLALMSFWTTFWERNFYCVN